MPQQTVIEQEHGHSSSDGHESTGTTRGFLIIADRSAKGPDAFRELFFGGVDARTKTLTVCFGDEVAWCVQPPASFYVRFPEGSPFEGEPHTIESAENVSGAFKIATLAGDANRVFPYDIYITGTGEKLDPLMIVSGPPPENRP